MLSFVTCLVEHNCSTISSFAFWISLIPPSEQSFDLGDCVSPFRTVHIITFLQLCIFFLIGLPSIACCTSCVWDVRGKNLNTDGYRLFFNNISVYYFRVVLGNQCA